MNFVDKLLNQIWSGNQKRRKRLKSTLSSIEHLEGRTLLSATHSLTQHHNDQIASDDQFEDNDTPAQAGLNADLGPLACTRESTGA